MRRDDEPPKESPEKDKKDKKDDSNKEDDDGDEEDPFKGPETVEQWLQKQKKKKLTFTTQESFHTIFVRDDLKKIYWRVEEDKMSTLFFPQVTSQGGEGQFPSNFDHTPKNVGLQFRFAPNKKDVLLVEAL